VPFFQIGETKYGRPMLDRVVNPRRRWAKRSRSASCRSTRRFAPTSPSACRST
jgi:predicted proteasome-type protease